MKWNTLTSLDQLAAIDSESETKRVLLFKHSTRCSISDAALSRFERKWKDEYTEQITPYYLDLIAFRTISDKIAEKYAVYHQSPQVFIEKGKCIFNESHTGIDVDEIVAI